MNLGHEVVKGLAVNLRIEIFVLNVLESQAALLVFPAQPGHFLLANRAMAVVEERKIRRVIHEAVFSRRRWLF